MSAKLPRRQVLLAAAATGIGVAFDVPVTGVVFTLEEVRFRIFVGVRLGGGLIAFVTSCALHLLLDRWHCRLSLPFSPQYLDTYSTPAIPWSLPAALPPMLINPFHPTEKTHR